MARRRLPPQSLTRRNPGKLATAASQSCWWTETGWLCCTTETPWPACFPGGVSTPGGSGSNRRSPIRRASNPSMIPVAPSPGAAPMGANQYVVAPHGATPGATAWLYTVGVSMPTMVRITAIYNNPSGIFVDVTPTFAPSVAEIFGPSQTGGFGEVLAPFSQGGSVRTTAGAPVRTMNPYYDVQGSLARAGRATRSDCLPYVPTETTSFSMRPVRNPPAKSLANPSNPRAGQYNYRAWPGNLPAGTTCMVDLASLTLHCPGSPLHGVAVTDVEGEGGEEGELIAVSYVDPISGAEVVTELAVAPEQGVPWWEHDGHCCESCALGEGCSDCEDAA